MISYAMQLGELLQLGDIHMEGTRALLDKTVSLTLSLSLPP